MRIFNQDKTMELQSPDLERGYLKDDKLLIAHHPAVEGVSHKEIVAEYPNGGKDIKTVWDVMPQEERFDYEDIKVYIPYTAEELKARQDAKRTAALKAELAKVKEDIEQEVFGMIRDDYAEKKARAAEIVNELRVLEGKEPREIRARVL